MRSPQVMRRNVLHIVTVLEVNLSPKKVTFERLNVCTAYVYSLIPCLRSRESRIVRTCSRSRIPRTVGPRSWICGWDSYTSRSFGIAPLVIVSWQTQCDG